MDNIENLKKLKKDMDNLSGVSYDWFMNTLRCWVDDFSLEDFMLLLREHCDTFSVDGRIFGDYVYIDLVRELPFDMCDFEAVFPKEK